MEEIPLLKDIVIIFGLSITVLLFCHRLRIPTIVGFLVTGVICGPHGLGVIGDVDDVQVLASIGIILLLFIVGMEFSIKRLLQYKRFFLLGGLMQVILTGGVSFGIAQLIGRPIGESLFLGCLISLSSTAIVMRVLEERGESASPHGKVTLSILILQDVLVVPMVLLTPVMAGVNTNFDITLIYAVTKGVVILVVTFILAELIVPRLLYYIARTRSRELFILGVLTICSTVAWLASNAGVSLSLGAFLAGLIVSESEYSHEAIGDIIPFQDIFTSFFFVSMGMLLDTGYLMAHPFLIATLAISIIFLKSSAMALVTLVLGMPLRTAVLSGIALCQVGEFSFVLIRTGMDFGIGTEYHYQLFLAVSLLTMAVTPTLIHWSPSIANALIHLPIPPTMKFGLKPIIQKSEDRERDHIIIIGFDMGGKNLAHSSREANIPYLILEMDPEIVRLERERGEPIHFGDATHESVLKHANILEARVVAVSLHDPVTAMRIVKQVRKLNPSAYLIVRTRYMEEVRLMYQLGADDVIPDEFGSSVEIFTRVLRKFNIPHEKISDYVQQMRTEGYEMLRLLYREPTVFSEIHKDLRDVSTEAVRIGNNSPLVGKSLKESDLRNNYKVTAILIKRGNDTICNPEANEVLHENDVVVLLGKTKNLAKVIGIFRAQKS
ncbi:MAG: cation:proton antiporter [Chlamydiales bacterium]|nr:cation:proton antiporter [Chlamydiia bacterium]MCP5508100.1 cation:proton antiporter [Chlamydiales bacterium]